MKNIHPSCPDCRVEMAEYYVGLVPIGVFLSLDKVTTYICRGCGRIIFRKSFREDITNRINAVHSITNTVCNKWRETNWQLHMQARAIQVLKSLINESIS